jgi:multidrug resistance efflux pump
MAAQSPAIPRSAASRKKKALILLLALAVLASAGFGLTRFTEDKAANLPSFEVKPAEFVISLTLKGGELEAVQAENITAPRVRGALKIVQLFPEGEQVKVGDLLVQFEPTEYNKRLMDAQQAVEGAVAEKEKTLANQKAELARLESAIKDQEASLRLAELQVERMAFEAASEREKAQIEALRAKLSHAQAVEKLEAQKIINAADLKKNELEISRTERELEKAQRDLESITIKAAKPGLVVYGKIWKGERPEKIRVGDEVWGGVTVISLPDLSKMQVKTYTNEVDVDKLKVGQQVEIKLDALPEPTFHGTITSIASLGREKEGEKNVKVFDVLISIAEQDSRLKPGMSATGRVIIETVPPPPPEKPGEVSSAAVAEAQPGALPLFVPLDAVFEKNGQAVVYLLRDGKPQERPVVLGKKNEDYVIVEEGLEVGDRISLRDPTLVTQEAAGAGGEQKAEEQGVKIQ